MKTKEDLQLEFGAWFKAHFQPTADLDQVKLAMVKEVARRAFYEGNAIGFNDGMTAGAQMQGAGQ